MAHFTHDDIIDLALNGIKTDADLMVLLEGIPTTYANATTANGTGSGQKIAEVAMIATDYTLANGDVSGRKVTCAAKSTQNVDTAGNGSYVAYLDVSATKILHYYEMAAPRNGLIVNDKVNFPVHDFEIRDTVAE